MYVMYPFIPVDHYLQHDCSQVIKHRTYQPLVFTNFYSLTRLKSVQFKLRFSALIGSGVERLYLIKTQVGTLFGILFAKFAVVIM